MQFEFFREIPSNLDPNFAANLVFSKDKKRKDRSGDVYSAIILSLVRKKYIEFVKVNEFKDWTFSNVKVLLKHIPVKPTELLSEQPLETVEVVKEELEPLTKTEEYYYNLLIRHAKNNEITMSAFQRKVSNDYANTNTFVTNMNNSIVNIGITDGYFQKARYDSVKKYLQSLSTCHLIFGIL